MPQIFGRGADTWFRLVLSGAVLAIVAIFPLVGGYVRSDWRTEVGYAPEQPVPFSHEHHVGGLGIDCRYCHTSVETAATAGFPPMETCMTCHSQIWTGAPMLEPVREGYARDVALRWIRVHDLKDFAYFDHSVHVSAGVGCETCHGRVDRMPLTRQVEPLTMQWCLDCHRDPAPALRPREAVFEMGWRPPADRRALGQTLIEAHGIEVGSLDNCYVCHR